MTSAVPIRNCVSSERLSINLYFQGALSTGAEHIASDLQPIRLTEHVTHQRQPSVLLMRGRQRRSHRARLCAVLQSNRPVLDEGL